MSEVEFHTGAAFLNTVGSDVGARYAQECPALSGNLGGTAEVFVPWMKLPFFM